MSEEITFVATGDSFITRRLPETPSSSFEEVVNLISQGDFKFTNFEVITPKESAPPSPVSGGTWARADRRVIKDLKKYGFNSVNLATNHVLDYLYEGLKDTEQALQEEDLLYVGAGKSMSEAAEPKYVESYNGRVALIGVTSTFEPNWMAGYARRDVPGRPGVNGLRVETTYCLSDENLTILNGIADRSGINNQRQLDVKEGFLPPDETDVVRLGVYRFKKGLDGSVESIPNKEDMERIVAKIHEAKRQADYVVISFHSHEMKGDQKQLPASFMEVAARTFIDEGASAVIGHGPHILRGIQVYKGCPIFYSLGNFIFQNETVSHLPHDFYKKYNLSDLHGVADGFDVRSKKGKIGLGANSKVWESVIVKWKMKNSKLEEILLYPIELGFELPRYRKGWPTLSNDMSIIQKLADLSKPFGTNIQIDGGKGVIKVK